MQSWLEHYWWMDMNEIKEVNLLVKILKERIFK